MLGGSGGLLSDFVGGGLHIGLGGDVAQLHHERPCVGRIGHQARLIEHRSHAAGIAECLVDALQSGIDEVELVGHRVGVGEHDDDRARRDAEPGVAAGDEHRHHAHDDQCDARGDDAAGQRCLHALRVARHHFAVRLVEQRALVIFPAIGLHSQDVRDRVGQLARQLVLRPGRLLVQVQDALVHDVAHRSVHG